MRKRGKVAVTVEAARLHVLVHDDPEGRAG
jgi:hypothetical protein